LHVLHGETGSGKTRVYIELAAERLAQGKSVIVLTPEIGLTSQLADNFTRVFGGRVVVLHSQLTEATRERAWQYLLEQPEPVIVIGARSALFSPLRNIGLIVIDEAHETAYKQDQAPYYHTTTVAAKLAQLHQATLVLGSATPLVSDYYIATAKQRPIVRMTELAKGNDAQSSVAVIDLKARDQFSKSPYLSNALIAAIKNTIGKGEQTLLFLNRRGTARVIFCEHCGWQALCPHCDLPLVYHGDSHAMRCHSCDFAAASPVSCPDCRNATVMYKSVGTKAIVDEAQRLFPEARIMRFDTDNKKTERIEQHYNALRDGQVDIIVGTQTLAKGLDLPRLSLVGVIIADTGLFFPDFSAQERTYQLLRQVLGRIGRGHRDGHAIVQTYAPDSPLLGSVLTKNWETFYNKELAERRRFTFPPFCYLLHLGCKRASSNAAQNAADAFALQIRRQFPRVVVEGPSPSFHEKIQGKYNWQLVVKARRRDDLLAIIHALPSGWSYDIDPMNLL
jgi:primosomal protein N' (replication factor Y)